MPLSPALPDKLRAADGLDGAVVGSSDGVVGNEVLDATANGGLVRSGSGTAGAPYTLGLRTDCARNEILRFTASGWICSQPVYEKIAIWAEEAAGIDSGDEYSFGNGATGSIGIPLAEDWEIYAVAFNADVVTVGSSVRVSVQNQDTNTDLHVFMTSAATTANILSYTETLPVPVPVPVPAGTSIGFSTLGENGQVSDGRAVVYLRRLP